MYRLSRFAVLSLTMLAGCASAGAGRIHDALPEAAEILAPLLPAVVNVTSSGIVASSPGGSAGQGAPHSKTSAGSGFIIDPAGYIVTNRHVVQGASEITVTMNDNTMLRAQMVAQAYHSDIALLKVTSAKPLPALKFGDSDGVRIGDRVFAVGNPLGIGQSVSAGIVSALNRNIHLTMWDEYIQTDASINHGNSGGPLLNTRGEVIGVNTALMSPTAGSVGIGFAMPSLEAQYLVAMLRDRGHVEAGYIGVWFQQVTPTIAEAAGLPGAGGGIVVGVDGNGPARGKLLRGDVILGVDGLPVHDIRMLWREILTTIDKPIVLEVWRDGTMESVTLETITIVDDMDDRANDRPMLPPRLRQASDMGLRLAVLTDELRSRFKLGPERAGIVVTETVRGSAAEDEGIEAGDVILCVQRRDVATPEDLERQLQDIRRRHGQYVLLLVNGRNGTRWAALPIGN